jgi:hypothetical protein
VRDSVLETQENLEVLNPRRCNRLSTSRKNLATPSLLAVGVMCDGDARIEETDRELVMRHGRVVIITP